jgi:hypothetical protein
LIFLRADQSSWDDQKAMNNATMIGILGFTFNQAKAFVGCNECALELLEMWKESGLEFKPGVAAQVAFEFKQNALQTIKNDPEIVEKTLWSLVEFAAFANWTLILAAIEAGMNPEEAKKAEEIELTMWKKLVNPTPMGAYVKR